MKVSPALVLVGLCACASLVIAATSPDPTGPATAIALAAFLAMPSPLALGWAGLASVLALGETSAVEFRPLALAGTLALGLSLGGLSRFLSGRGGLFAPSKRLMALTLMGLVGLTLVWLPDGRILLETSDGEPLYASATVQSVLDGTRFQTFFRASVLSSPASETVKVALSAALIMGLLLVPYGAFVPHKRAEKAGWMVALLAGLALGVYAMWGQVQAFGAIVELPDADNLRAYLTHIGDGSLVVDEVQLPPEAFLGLSSRPALHVLRLVGGLSLALLAFKSLRERVGAEDVRPAASLELGTAALFLLGALACMELSGGAFYVICAALLLTLVVSFLGLFTACHRHLVDAMAFGALCLVLLATLGPMAGWLGSQ